MNRPISTKIGRHVPTLNKTVDEVPIPKKLKIDAYTDINRIQFKVALLVATMLHFKMVFTADGNT